MLALSNNIKQAIYVICFHNVFSSQNLCTAILNISKWQRMYYAKKRKYFHLNDNLIYYISIKKDIYEHKKKPPINLVRYQRDN